MYPTHFPQSYSRQQNAFNGKENKDVAFLFSRSSDDIFSPPAKTKIFLQCLKFKQLNIHNKFIDEKKIEWFGWIGEQPNKQIWHENKRTKKYIRKMEYEMGQKNKTKNKITRKQQNQNKIEKKKY